MQEDINQLENKEIRWAIQKRLTFLETRLYWEGQINRGDLVRRFKISVPQASADIAQYSKLASENIEYDSTKKAYVATENFEPLFFVPSSEQYLSHLRAINDDVLDAESSIIGFIPEYGALSIPRRAIAPKVLQKIISALRHNKSVEVCYESYSQAEISWRWISPHAIASDGNRWHVRAYCHKHENFRDFVLGRISDARNTNESTVDSGQDSDWHTIIQVRLFVNSKLPETKQKIVERDYVMKNGVLEIGLRRSLLYYLYYNLNFNNPSDTDLLVLEDRETIESIIFREQKIVT